MVFQTEYDFTLPKGYVDEHGSLHREGVMRLAKAADEIMPLKDPKIQQNPSYKTVIVLSRVITKLGSLKAITPKIIESLYASDLAYLQSLYNKINCKTTSSRIVTPNCKKEFKVTSGNTGE